MSGRTILSLSAANIEVVQDTVGAMLTNSATVTWSYNDAAGTITATAAGVTAHSSLTGLTSGDDHTQYAFLAGRSGGQILYGSTAASENLRLEGTVHATPGTVYTSASSFGVGGVPTAKAHVFAGATAGGGLQVDGTSSPKIRVAETGSSVYTDVQSDGASGYAGTTSNHPFILRANNAAQVKLQGSGNHGINTSDIEAWQADYRGIHVGAYANIMHGNAVNGVWLNDNLYYDGAWKYRTANPGAQLTVQNGFVFNTSVSGTADTAATFSEQMVINGTGTLGITVGAPTGGAKGLGTLNAQAVYDDNVLLTCYVLDQALDGSVDVPKWDAKVPPRIYRDREGKVLSIETRTHKPLRRFVARMGTAYDPMDLDKFWQHVVDKRHLTAYPNETKYDPAEGKQDIGNWQQQTIELLEIYAVHIHKLNTRLKTLENSGTSTTVIT